MRRVLTKLFNVPIGKPVYLLVRPEPRVKGA